MRWADAPPVYSPRKTFHNRFVCWASKGVWEDIIHALAAMGGPPAQVMIDPTGMRAQPLASGGKGGRAPRPSDSPVAVEPPKYAP